MIRIEKKILQVDFLAGLAVAVVALPLALGFAVTTGAPPAAGIATAFVAGLIAAILGGSEYQVSGPTGAMTVILVPIVAKYGYPSLAVVGVVAGLLMVIAGALRIGRYMERLPWSVMEGFTLGIALTIALQQLPIVLNTLKGQGSEALVVAFETIKNTVWEQKTLLSIGLVLFALLVKFSWRNYSTRKEFKIFIPGSIIAVAATTLVAQVSDLDVPRVGNIDASTLFTWGLDTSNISVRAIATAGIAIALLGGIESLLSARMADAMVHRRDGYVERPHQPNRELIGQGVATMASSFAGGMPATGAIARTSVNIHAGAKTRWASAIHALLLITFVLFLEPLVSQIPMAALAGVLIGTSWRIANPSSVREALQTTRLERVTFLATAAGVVAIDLIWGIILGLVVHIIFSRRIKWQQQHR